MGKRKRPSRYPILKRSFPASPGRRFLSFLADSLILIACTAALFLPTFNLVMASPIYAAQESKIVDEVNYYKGYSKESKVLDYGDDGEALSQDKTIYIYISRAICLSYEVFGTEGEPDFKLNEKVKKYGTLSKDNANLCYFYTTYLAQPEHKDYVDMKGKTNAEFYYDQYYEGFSKPSSFFDMGSAKQSEYGLPVMKNTVAYTLMKESFSGDGSLSASTYQEIAEGLAIMLDNAESYLLNAEPYYSTHYRPYCAATIECAKIINVYLLITIMVAGLVVYVLPKIIFKDETTFGRKFIGLGVVQADSSQNPWWITIMRSVVEIMSAIPAMLVMYLFPPFNVDLNTLVMPLGLDVKFNFAFIILGVALVYLLCKVPLLFNHKRQSVMDLLSNSVVVDSHFQEDDIDEDIEAKPL